MLDWSVNEVQASEGQIDSDGYEARCLQLVASFVVAVDIYGWMDCGQRLGPAVAEQNVHDTCLA